MEWESVKVHRRCYSGSSLVKKRWIFYTFNHLKSDARIWELGRLQNSKTKYMILSLTWGGRQLKDATTVHLGSSLSQAEEQGALFAAGGPVKILVEFTELETSPV